MAHVSYYPHEPGYIPSKQEIKAVCQEIQKTWTPLERYQRIHGRIFNEATAASRLSMRDIVPPAPESLLHRESLQQELE